ncbi:MAG: hypothetical protein HYY78_02845 [Betaproteobacteria bacterium]|nr:hypothetical protein [Betaproteobacteria bacterium]
MAELGYKGGAVPLQRVESGKEVFYEARLRLTVPNARVAFEFDERCVTDGTLAS